ncbi:MAG: SDR family oxidoreductase [Novosphingobium sp.]|nr:SDR family oxidoreductase [Novosphingobium sp.]
MDLSQAKHAFITGGASGLGLGMADALARRGIAVTIADINEDALAEVLKTRGNQFRGIRLDTRDREAWQKAKADAEADFGPVDILINNAGISPNGREFADMEPETFDRILAINLVGIVNGVFAFAADFRERGTGHIVCTSSQAGLVTTVAGVGAYSVAKFGVTALGEQLRREMEPHGVGVTVLCPGYVQTNLGANTLRIGGEIRQYSAAMPGSDVTPADVGEMVADAIECNAAYVMTHKDVWPGIEQRMNAIREACDYRVEH